MDWETAVELTRWNPISQVIVLLRYIENNGDNDAFQDFLKEKVNEELNLDDAL